MGSLKFPHIGLVEVGRLGQWLNVPTQGRRVAQTGDERPFSLTAPGTDPQPGTKPRLHWWEVDMLPLGHLSTLESSQGPAIQSLLLVHEANVSFYLLIFLTGNRNSSG